MARIRSIKPGFCSSEDIAGLTRDERLHFILLWTYADDKGRGKDHPKLLKAELYPLDDDISTTMVEEWQVALEQKDRIRRYEIGGRRYFEVVNWDHHQKPQHPKESTLPTVPDDWSKPSARPEKPHEASPELVPVVVVGEVDVEGGECCAGSDAEKPLPAQHLATTASSRRTDPLFDAVVAACGLDPGELTKSARGGLNSALKDLRDVNADPAQVPARAAVFRSRWDVPLTPPALAKHWAACAPDHFVNQPKVTSNQAALMRAQARGA